MTTPETRRTGGLRLLDLAGLVVGYGMAALLIRSLWPDSRPLVGVPAVMLGLEYLWLGLAMGGPIVLLFDRRVAPDDPRPRRPKLGRLISSKEPADAPHPAGSDSPASWPYTRAEMAWMLIGGYWIALTMFVVSARSIHSIAGPVGLIQGAVAMALLLLVVPRRVKPGTASDSWTHLAALWVLWTWPIAWAVLILLSQGV